MRQDKNKIFSKNPNALCDCISIVACIMYADLATGVKLHNYVLIRANDK
jgi:hypothetical protein